MKLLSIPSYTLSLIPLFLSLPVRVLGADILKSGSYNACMASSDVRVDKLNIQYDPVSRNVTFDVAGSCAKSQKVMASLKVSVYGKEVYTRDFNPCDDSTKVEMLCPIPAGHFAADGRVEIPQQYASQIPSIAFNVPDLDAEVHLVLKKLDTGEQVACLDGHVNNGKTVNTKLVSYAAAGMAGEIVVMSGISAAGSAFSGAAGSGAQPSFGTLVGHFQGIAMSGMLSVDYPPVYRSFTKNFAFSTGLVPWTQMQTSIDNFRNITGGNLTEANYRYLLNNVTLARQNGSNSTSGNPILKRSIDLSFGNAVLLTREIHTSVNGSGDAPSVLEGGTGGMNQTGVGGIAAYVESLSIPKANTFMTVLLVFAIVIVAIIVFMLLFKVILETWALFGSFPKKLTGFRKRYWGMIGRTITNLILVLYGIWTLYCVYQFTNGDSWAAKLLAGITLAVFTGLLLFFTFQIWKLARAAKKMEGSSEKLFKDKEVWIKYSLFYDQYKKDAWWVFVPYIVYMFAKGCVVAGGDGHGMAQTGSQLIVEMAFFIFLLWKKPFYRKVSNWVNISIQVVRALSVICILVFVQEFGIATTTKTVAGLVIIVIQCVLTAVLAILLCVDGIIICCKPNKHRQERKGLEQGKREDDDLTTFDKPRSSLDSDKKGGLAMTKITTRESKKDEAHDPSYSESKGLAHGAAPMGMEFNKGHGRNMSVESRWTDAGSMHQRNAPPSRGQWR